MKEIGLSLHEIVHKYFLIVVLLIILNIASIIIYPPTALLWVFVCSIVIFKILHDHNNSVHFINKRYLEAGVFASYGFLILTFIVFLRYNIFLGWFK